MEPTKLTYDVADLWAVKLCRGIDSRDAELGRMSDRAPYLALGAFVCLCGVSAVVQGKDAAMFRAFGQLASIVSFGGLPFFAGWFVRDRMRRKAIAREDAAASAELLRRGYEHIPGDRGHVLRLPRVAVPVE